MSSMVLLKVENLNSGYNGLQVLYSVNIEVEENEIVAVIGPNGSGKSTLLKSLFGLVTIYSGRILFEDRDITRLKPHERARLGLVYLPQVGSTFEKLTVRENIAMASFLLDPSIRRKRIENALEIFPTVRKFMDRKVYTLSGGERQMVAITMALIRNPKLIMFDEPTASLAPKIAREIIDKIALLRREHGLSIILVEQNTRLALEVSDRAYILVTGRCIYHGESRELLNDRDLGKLYLGLAHREDGFS